MGNITEYITEYKHIALSHGVHATRIRGCSCSDEHLQRVFHQPINHMKKPATEKRAFCSANRTPEQCPMEIL